MTNLCQINLDSLVLDFSLSAFSVGSSQLTQSQLYAIDTYTRTKTTVINAKVNRKSFTKIVLHKQKIPSEFQWL